MRGESGSLLMTFCLGAAMLAPGDGRAGVTLDGSLGRGGPLAGPDYAIRADLGRQVGNNLFHSFSSFDIARAESATFSGLSGTANVIGRITGGTASSIDGTLRSTILGANLYLINPAGLMFGPHAVLDVSGSFYAASADYLKFSDGTRFDAGRTTGAELTAASPLAFGFLGPTPARVEVVGSRLEVGEGRQLVLAGGDLAISGEGGGRLYAPAGMIGLLSAAGKDEIALAFGSAGIARSSSHGVVRVDGGETVRVDGVGGKIVIRAGRLEVLDSSLLAQNAGSTGGIDIVVGDRVLLEGAILQSATDMERSGGAIEIETGRLMVMNQAQIDTTTFGSGAGGRIVVRAADVMLDSGGRISNNVAEDATGHGGNTLIRATGTVLVHGASAGRSSSIHNNSSGVGDAGTLEISAESVHVSGGSVQSGTSALGAGGKISLKTGLLAIDTSGAVYVGTEGRGDAGRVEVEATHIAVTGDGAINAQAVGGGRAGEIGIRTETLDLNDGGTISARAYYYQRTGGDIAINATRYMHVTGRGEGLSLSPGSDEVSTGVFSFGGNIEVKTPELTLADSAGISTRTWNDLRSGNLTVETGRLALLDGGHLSADAIGHSGYHGGAGDLTVTAGESVVVSGVAGDRRSGIQSGTRSSGNAGRIRISTPVLRILDGGMVNTSTGVFGEGAAGDIHIHAGSVEVLSGGRVLSSSNGYGGGGDISILADSILLDHGSVSAFGSGGEGVAGRISLAAPRVVLRGGLVNTESDSGAGAGDIRIEAANLDMQSGSRIKSDSSGSGDAGAITMRIGSLLSVDDSTVTTGATYASGGNVDIRACSITLSNGSAITATVGGGYGDGGNVILTAHGIAAVGNSDVTARADQGHGGRIEINSEVFLHTRDVDLDASSNVSGNEGVVEVNAPNLDISGNLVVLPANFLNLSDMLRDPCLRRRDGDANSFVVRGRGGVAPAPDGLLPAGMKTDTLR